MLCIQPLRLARGAAGCWVLDAPHTVEARTRIDVLSWNQAIRDSIGIHKEVFGDGRDDERTQILAKRMDELVAKRLGGG